MKPQPKNIYKKKEREKKNWNNLKTFVIYGISFANSKQKRQFDTMN